MIKEHLPLIQRIAAQNLQLLFLTLLIFNALHRSPSNVTQASSPSKTNKQQKQLRTHTPNKTKALKEHTKG